METKPVDRAIGKLFTVEPLQIKDKGTVEQVYQTRGVVRVKTIKKP